MVGGYLMWLFFVCKSPSPRAAHLDDVEDLADVVEVERAVGVEGVEGVDGDGGVLHIVVDDAFDEDAVGMDDHEVPLPDMQFRLGPEVALYFAA